MSLVSLVIEALSQLRDVAISSPTNGQLVIYNSTTGKWENGSSTKVQLDYALSTDKAVALTQNTWVDFITNQNFTVDNPNSTILVCVSGNIQVTGVSGDYGSRIMVDSGGTPVTKMVGGTYNTGNGLSGTSLIAITGLAAGTHTIKLQLSSDIVVSNSYCRPATTQWESLQIRILECL